MTFVKNLHFELEFAIWGAQNLTFPEGVHVPNSRPICGRLLWWGRGASCSEKRRQDYSRSLSPQKTAGTKVILNSIFLPILAPSEFQLFNHYSIPFVITFSNAAITSLIDGTMSYLVVVNIQSMKALIFFIYFTRYDKKGDALIPTNVDWFWTCWDLISTL